MKKQLLIVALLALMAPGLVAQTVSSFENLRLPAQSFLNGKQVTTSGYVLSGGASFNNKYDTSFGGYWSRGFAISNQRNDSTPGFTNQYAAITGSGVSNSVNYAVAQSGSKVSVPASKNVQGVYVTNSTYAYLSMKNGDQFAKKFGGTTGDDPDFFTLTVTGYSSGMLKDTSVQFMLADFTATDNSADYTVNQWTWLDLTALADADSLVFGLTSSDTGMFGMNTPAYFCIDDFTMIDTGTTQLITTASFEEVQLKLDDYWNGKVTGPFTGFASGNAFFNNSYNSGFGYWSSGFAISNVKDSVTVGYTNQYAAVTAGGYQSEHYAVATGGARIRLTGDAAGKAVNGFYITNSTYAYRSMQNGDQFAKKFGGPNGTDPDYFEVVVRGHKNGSVQDSVVAVLADFRSNNPSEDYILNTWSWVDLLPLGDVDSLSFAFRSSDVGQFGMNTPAYFCIDDFTTKDAFAVPAITTGNVNATLCAGKTISLPYTTSENFNSGNVFNVQLSDATGNFTTPVVVGSVTAATSGTIAITIPGNTTAGTGYKLRVVGSNPNIEGSASNSFAIGLTPALPVITGDSVPFANDVKTYQVVENSGSSYTWSFTNGTGSSTTNTIDITWNQVGTTVLKVVEVSADGCASDTAEKPITINTAIGLSMINNQLEASVYPNPVAGELHINLPEGVNSADMRIYDAAGKEVMNQRGSIAPVNVSELSEGVYFLHITAGEQSTVKRFLVK